MFQAAIVWYIFSIVFGRLYCGMHSFTDCTVGVVLGATVWALYWAMENIIENWISTAGWYGKWFVYVELSIFNNFYRSSRDLDSSG